MVALVYEDHRTMRELGRPAAATARIGAETSPESEEEEARTATTPRRGVVAVGDREKAIFTFAARRGEEAEDALLALREGRDALVIIIGARAIVIVADIFSCVECEREEEIER